MTLRVVELFSGIGAQRMALTLAGIPHEVVGISEIDRHALKSYEAIYGDCPNLGDITKVEALPDCDLVTYSFPCQDLSLAGKRKGMGVGTRSGLVWEVVRLLESAEKRPEWLLMENVPQVLTAPEWPTLVRRLGEMGYRSRWAKIDSSKFGSAQKRVRAFMVSRLGQDPPSLPLCDPTAVPRVLRDVMEPTRGERFVRRIPLERIRWREPKEGYRHPQSEGLECHLMDASESRIESRRIASEDSLCPTLRRGCPQKTVTLEEEARVEPLVERAENLRMAPKGEKSVGTLTDDGIRMAVSPSEERRRESTPVAEDEGQTFYSRRMLYSADQPSPTLRTFHSRTDLIKVVADWQRDGRLDLANRLYAQDGLSPAMVCHGGGNRDIKIVKREDEGDLVTSIITPREAWRLMGFPDWAYERAEAVSSETQLYNQAGNSIVVEVLMAIFRTMFLTKGRTMQTTLDRDENENERR